MSEYILRTAKAKMPLKCWGRYNLIAIMEDEDGANPPMISERAKGVIRIVRTWEKLHVGKTSRCAYSKAYKEAEEYLEDLELLKELGVPVKPN